MILLTGCATAGDCEALVLYQYDKAQNAQLAQEIETAPASALWPNVVLDYASLRDQVKACKGESR